jgi:hypothetical protein
VKLANSSAPTVSRAIHHAHSDGAELRELLAPAKVGPSEGLIAAYQHDPATFRRYADLYDTAFNGLRIGTIVSANRTAYTLPMLGSELIVRGETKDAWGHPYCVAAHKEQILFVSGGAHVNSFSCAQRVGQLGRTQGSSQRSSRRGDSLR